MSGTGQRGLPISFVLRLQQTVGNREVHRFLTVRQPASTPLAPASWWTRLNRRVIGALASVTDGALKRLRIRG